MKPAAIFQPGMLLQRELPVSIWGSGTPGERIKITIQGKEASASVKEDGTWQLRLPPLEASPSETMTIQSGQACIRLENIAVGEVFIAAGQSNMEFWMRYEAHYRQMLADCENPHIRFYDMPKLAYDGQETDFDYHNVGVWRQATKTDLEYFSSAGYYFARKLEQDLSVPVGIIGCNWGGTKSLTWMTEAHAREIQKEQTAHFENLLGAQSYGDFCRAAGADPKNNTGNSSWDPFKEFILPRTPSPEEVAEFYRKNGHDEVSAANPKDAPGALYSHMVLRLAPYTARGVLWYQGESDDEIDGAREKYKSALDTIKNDWRDAWSSPALPFFIVQLPGFRSWLDCINRGYAVIRECQQKSADEDENAYLCSISDVGEEFDIHPKNKLAVGTRLALLAEKYVFHMDILADAPRLQEVKRTGNRITLSFANAQGGLTAGKSINALYVMEKSNPIDYEAALSGSELLLTLCEYVPGKLTIKFARDAWYQVNLCNQAGIPAIPFEVSCSDGEQKRFPVC